MPNNPYDQIIDQDLQGKDPAASVPTRQDNPYDALIDDDLNTLQLRARQQAMRATEAPASEFRVVEDVSRKLGVPFEAARENLPEIQRREKVEQIDAMIRQFSDPVRRTMLDRNLVPVLQDDLPRLKALENAIQNRDWYELDAVDRWSNAIFMGVSRLRDSYNRARIGDAAGILGMYEQGAQVLEQQGEEAYGQWFLENRDAIQALGPFDAAMMESLRFETPEDRAATLDRMRASLGEQAAGLAESQTAQQSRPQDPTFQNVSGFWDTVAAGLRNPESLARESLTSLIGSAPALLAGVVTRSPMASSTAVFAGGYAVEEPMKVIELMHQAGVDLSDDQQVVRAFTDPEFMKEIERRAALKAVGTAGVGTIFAGLAGTRIAPASISARQQELVNLIAQIPVQAAGEGIGEAAGQLLADGQIDASEVALEVMVGGIGAPVDVLAYGGGRFLDSAKGYRRAQRDRRYLRDVAEKSQQMESDNVSPEVLRELLQKAKQGGPVEEMHIPANEFQELFQSAGLNPDDIVRRMPSVAEEYETQLALGGDLTVSLEDFAAVVARTAVADDFINRARTEPRGMSPAQAEAWMNDAAAPLMESALNYNPNEVNEGADRVFDDVVSQLQQAGMDPDAAERNASLYRAFFAVLGQSENQDAWSLYQQFGLQIGRPTPDVLKPTAPSALDNLLDRLRAGEVPGDREIYGPSLVDWLRNQGGVRDDGGELAAMDANLSRLPGQRNLIQPEGRTLDDLAEIAMEAGYIPERDPNLLASMIGQELRGVPVFNRGNANAELQNLAADLAVLDEELRRQGLDIGSLSNQQIIDALNGALAAEPTGTVLNQQGEVFNAADVISAQVLAGPIGQAGLNPEQLDIVINEITRRSFDGVSGWVDARGGTMKSDMEAAALAFIEETGENVRYLSMDIANLGGLNAFRNDVADIANADFRRLTDIVAEEINTLGEAVFMRTGGDELGAFVVGVTEAQLNAAMDTARARIYEYAKEQGFHDIPHAKGKNFRGVSMYGASAELLIDQPRGTVYKEADEKLKQITPDLGEENVAAAQQDTRSGAAVVQQEQPPGGGAGEPAGQEGQAANTERLRQLLTDTETPADAGVSASGAPDQQELFQSRGQDSARGRILFDRELRNFRIELLERADLSTFLHESGHYFLEVMGALAESEGASERLQQTWSDTLKWMGVESQEAIGTEQHERFARAFEAYLREGKAPATQLADIFRRFRAWLKQIYRRLRELDVELTPEVVSVFDRMLATDEQIRAAREEMAAADELETVDLRWSDEEKRKLAEFRERARTQAEDELMAAQMRDMEKANQAWWQRERDQVLADVYEQLNRDPTYQARAMLTHSRRPDGTETPTGTPRLKLDKRALVREFGEEYLKRLPSPKNPDNKAPGYVYAAKDGADPEMVARFYGFDSTRALVDALIGSKPIQQYANALADQTMRERYPDINLSGKARELANEAVYNDAQAQLVIMELRKLEARAGRDATIATMYRQKAEQVVAERRIRDLRPDLYARAATKHAGEAFSAAARGDFEGAVLAKQRQLLNHYLYREATKAKEESERIYRYTKKFDKTATRAELGKAGDGYLDRIDDIIDSYEFKRVTLRALDRRQSLRDWMTQQQEAGRHVDLPAEILDRTGRVNWREVTIEELQAVYDAIKNLEHTARLKTKLMSDAQQRDLETMVNAAAERILESGKGNKQFGYADLGTFRYKMEGAKQSYLSIFLNPDTLVRELDGFEDLGPVYQATKGLVDRAVAENLLPMQEKYLQKLADIYNKHYTRSEQRQFSKAMMTVDGIGKVSKDMALSLALNWGNEYNRESVMAGVVGGKKQISPEAAARILDQLDKRDWEFAQDVWDLLDFEFWPLVQKKERERKGVAPPKVEASPVKTKYGVYRGGYYPVKFESAFSFRVTEEQAEELAKSIRIGRFSKAQTKRGHVEARTGTAGRPVQLSLSALHQHVNQVISDLAIGDAVTDVQRVISHKTFVEAMDATGNTWVLRALDMWLKDTAAGEVIPGDVVTKMVRHVRTGFTLSKLGWNIFTILLQPMGVFQTAAQIGTRHMLRGMSALVRAPWFGENSIFNDVDSRSTFMRHRGASFNKDIQDTITAMRRSGWLESGLEKFMPGDWSKRTANAVHESFMIGIVKFQRLVDVAVWLGAYDQGKGKFTTDEEALQYADRMVARTQASGIFSDRSAIERGTISNNTRQSEFIRIWTTMASFMFAKGNIAYEKTKNTSFKDPVQLMMWASDMMLLFVYEALVIAWARGQWPDDDDDESVPEFMLNTVAGNVAGSFPFLRELSSELAGFRGGSALSQFYDQAGKTVTQVEQGEVDAALLKSLNNLGGILFHYPSSQTNRTMEALWRDIQGEDVEAVDYLIWREKD